MDGDGGFPVSVRVEWSSDVETLRREKEICA